MTAYKSIKCDKCDVFIVAKTKQKTGILLKQTFILKSDLGGG